MQILVSLGVLRTGGKANVFFPYRYCIGFCLKGDPLGLKGRLRNGLSLHTDPGDKFHVLTTTNMEFEITILYIAVRLSLTKLPGFLLVYIFLSIHYFSPFPITTNFL